MIFSKTSWAFLAMLSLAASSFAADSNPPPLKVGLVGLDSSHCVRFTALLNSTPSKPGLENVRVVAAFPGGSPDIPSSIERLPKFTEEVAALGVKIVPSIADVVAQVDVVIMNSVDGRVHLQQAREVIAAGKPLFVDKPLASSLKEGIELLTLAKEKGVPCFSSSSLRYAPQIQKYLNAPKIGPVLGCVTYGPCSLEEHHPDLYWYGIHGVEMLFTIMGPGCETVTRTHDAGADVVTGQWKDGRIATYRGTRDGRSSFGALVFGKSGNEYSEVPVDYSLLVEQIVKFFRTNTSPVNPVESLEILAFMDAADESRRQGGVPVKLDTLFKAAGQNRPE
ncbi:Gfo/Idh/MocA family protein [Planctomicrobium sp. SH664]|uniref:Gfo/Idh/MocA family protein n=1 Tax=Planctomicrobium sp. SH664 TaxID=3448125 RepID=UPI003F5C7777